MIELGSGISKAAMRCQALLASATPVTDKKGIAPPPSPRATEIDVLVGEAMTKVGHDGVVSVSGGARRRRLRQGFISAYFITDFDARKRSKAPRRSARCRTCCHCWKVAESGKRDRRRDVEGGALDVVNAIRKTLKAVAVKAPFFGDRRKAFLDDAVTGGQVITRSGCCCVR
jgi:chaperonin GroEL